MLHGQQNVKKLVSSVVRTEPQALLPEEKERHLCQSVRTRLDVIQELCTRSVESVNIISSAHSRSESLQCRAAVVSGMWPSGAHVSASMSPYRRHNN